MGFPKNKPKSKNKTKSEMNKLFTKASLCMILSLLEERVNSTAIFHSIIDSKFLNPRTKNDFHLKVSVFLSNINALNTSSLLSFHVVPLRYFYFPFYQSIFFAQYYSRLLVSYTISLTHSLWNVCRFTSDIISKSNNTIFTKTMVRLL